MRKNWGVLQQCNVPDFWIFTERMTVMEEKREERQIVLQSGFAAKMENFWYHYKWPTIGILFAVIVVLICTLQTCTKEKEDIVILYAGRVTLSSAQTKDLARMMDGVLPEDFDKNGEKRAALSTYQILSEEQIKKIAAETDSEGRSGYVDRSRNTDQYSVYTNYLKTGESSVLLLDPWLYEQLKGENRLRPLQEVDASLQEISADGYGIRLGDTEMYKTYGVYQVLPEDTVICLMRPYVIGRSSKAEAYQFEVDTFLALAGKSLGE